jgi:hypothetical protein
MISGTTVKTSLRARAIFLAGKMSSATTSTKQKRVETIEDDESSGVEAALKDLPPMQRFDSVSKEKLGTLEQLIDKASAYSKFLVGCVSKWAFIHAFLANARSHVFARGSNWRQIIARCLVRREVS